jgi:DNA-binding ferritin-like protein
MQPTETNGKEQAAKTVQNAAERVRQYGEQSEGRLGDVARNTADKMSRAADYMRNHDMNDMWNDAGQFLRRYPTQSVVAALVLGMLVGRSMRRDSY